MTFQRRRSAPLLRQRRPEHVHKRGVQLAELDDGRLGGLAGRAAQPLAVARAAAALRGDGVRGLELVVGGLALGPRRRVVLVQLQLLQVLGVEPEVGDGEGAEAGRAVGGGGGGVGGGVVARPVVRHLLLRLGRVPALARHLPLDEARDLGDGAAAVDRAGVDGCAEHGVHVQRVVAGAARAVLQERQDPLHPPHQVAEQPVVVDVHLVDEFVQVVLVPCAQVDEGLHCLVRVGGEILALGRFDRSDCVTDEHGEVGDAAVYVGRLVHAHKRLVEDLEEVTEEL